MNGENQENDNREDDNRENDTPEDGNRENDTPENGNRADNNRGNGNGGQEPRYRFFRHRDCEMFPCHTGVPPEDFNCLFCYCPLYALGEACGGQFSYTASGVKNCKDCNFPHRRENYGAVLSRFPELAALAGRRKQA